LSSPIAHFVVWADIWQWDKTSKVLHPLHICWQQA
jgi:hypothetical protein